MNLFPYQIEGVQFLASRTNAFLADTMGLGKSAQTIVACDAVDAKRILVLCPASVRYNWDREFGRFSDRNRPTGLLFTGKDKPCFEGVTICSYDLLRSKPVHRMLMSQTWDVLILDEVHYLKSKGAGRTQAVFGPTLDGRNGLSGRSSRVWALSGTPAPNDPSELFVVLKAFGAYKKTYWDFVGQFCVSQKTNFGIKITGAKNVPELKAVMAPYLLRRKKEDVMKELPPIRYQNVVLDPAFGTHPEDLASWKKAEEKHAAELQLELKSFEEDDISLENPHFATLRRFTGMAKVRPAAAMISEELHHPRGIDKIVVFAIHRDVIMYFQECLRAYNPVVVWGGTPPEKKQRFIEKFMYNPRCRIFIGNINAAGTGIDGLQGSCSEVLFLEASWTPASNAQAIMRVHRIGQKNPVRVRFLALAGSIDEKIQMALRRKTAMVDEILG